MSSLLPSHATPTGMPAAPKILVSACLAGRPDRYDGRCAASVDGMLALWLAEGKALAFCPETAGGLQVPREPAEIVGGTAADVLDGRARVLDASGKDVTSAFVSGANAALRIAKDLGIRVAVLKDCSPSCATCWVHDGTFSGKLIPGRGITAELLEQHGIQTYSETLLGDAAAACIGSRTEKAEGGIRR